MRKITKRVELFKIKIGEQHTYYATNREIANNPEIFKKSGDKILTNRLRDCCVCQRESLLTEIVVIKDDYSTGLDCGALLHSLFHCYHCKSLVDPDKEVSVGRAWYEKLQNTNT